MSENLLRTPLNEVHRREGGKMVEFGGWDMPIEYSGTKLKQEHLAVRSSIGLFDLSHMGEVEITGKDATNFIDSLVTNDALRIEQGQCQYTCMCRPTGAIIDDLLIYRFPDNEDGTPYYWLVINASNHDKDVAWILEHVKGDVKVRDLSMETALIAVQGPKAQEFLQPFVDCDLDLLSYYHVTRGTACGISAVISRTGYTGEDGFEIYVAWDKAEEVWNELRKSGEILPIGLGARDTLRLEAGYSLYGHEINEDTDPINSSLGWVTKFGVPDFNGKEALAAIKQEGIKKAIVGLVVQSRAIPRQGCVVESAEGPVGVVTSGTFSPSLSRGIALASVDAAHRSPGTELFVVVRGKKEPAVVQRPPFVRGSVRSGK